jgi:hypothetical protein
VEVAASEGDAVARGGEIALIVCGCFFFCFACKEGLHERGRMRLFLFFCMQRGILGEENARFPNLSQAGASRGVVRTEAISSYEERQTGDPTVSKKNVHALFFLVVRRRRFAVKFYRALTSKQKTCILTRLWPFRWG